MKSYTTRDVAKLLGLSEAQVRSQARVGYLSPDRGPRNAYRFSFQDLVLLRTAKALSEARIAPRRIRRALRTLTRQLPAGRSLSGLRISSEGDRVVVRDGNETWNPESGQLLLDFHVADLADRAAPTARRLARRARRSDEPLTAEQWYSLGVDLESAAPQDATRRLHPRGGARPPARVRPGQPRPLAPGGRPPGAGDRRVPRRSRVAAAASHRGVQPGHRARGAGPAGRGDRGLPQGARRRRPSSRMRTSTWRGCTSRPASGAAALRHLKAYKMLSE